MKLFDIFRKSKRVPEPERPKKKAIEKKPPKIEVKEKVKKAKKERPPKAVKARPLKPKKTSVSAYRILKAPHVTEKATDLVKKNQYIFKVWPRANKVEIREAIEDLYGVNVTSVKVIKVPAKQRRLGKIKGWRKGYKKAIVKIKEGQKIEVLPR